MYDRPFIVSWGFGVNSTALLLGLHERGIRPDLITAADTGGWGGIGEKPETYAFAWDMQAWLDRVGFPPITLVTKRSRYASLEDNCLQKQMLPSRAYGFSSCADKWKRQPQDRFVNHWAPAREAWAAGQKVSKALGYDAGEVRRARIPEDAKYRYVYPLIDWGWDREDCVAAITRHGLPVPPKSACFFCPSSTKTEVRWLAAHHPALFARAVAMERNAAGSLQTVQGLGRHWSWEGLLANDRAALDAPDVAQDQPCGCYDGGGDE